MFEFCGARGDDTTQWTELKLQSRRGGRVLCASGEELAGPSRSAAVSLKEASSEELAGVSRVAAIEFGVKPKGRRSEPSCGSESRGLQRRTRCQNYGVCVPTCVASSSELSGWDLLRLDQLVTRHSRV